MTYWQEFESAGWLMSLFTVPAILAGLAWVGLGWGTPSGKRLTVLMVATLVLFVASAAFGVGWAFLTVGALNLLMWSADGVAREPNPVTVRPWAAVVFTLPLVPAAFYGAEPLTTVLVWMTFIVAPWVAACHKPDDAPQNPELVVDANGQRVRVEEAAEKQAQAERVIAEREAAAANRASLWERVPQLPNESYQQRRKRVLAQRRRDITLAARRGAAASPLY